MFLYYPGGSLGSVLCLSKVSDFGAICILAYVFILTIAFMLKSALNDVT